MNYYIDTEFLEGTQDKTIFGIKYGKTKPTIDLISIALVGEDGREYYAISKDFNLKEAWNRWDMKWGLKAPKGANVEISEDVIYKKVYWIRDNVLMPIYIELLKKEVEHIHKAIRLGIGYEIPYAPEFCYKTLKYLINKYGKTNKQIAEEIKEFVGHDLPEYHLTYGNTPKFYGYFADYDWVAFCWLFGRMIDLPKRFPMYCIDLKQELDKITNEGLDKTYTIDNIGVFAGKLKSHPNYPKQTNTHNALADAKWNRELYKFLESL